MGSMRDDAEWLKRVVLLSDYETAKPLLGYYTLQGVEPEKIAALLYRKGVLDGKQKSRAQLNKLHAERHELCQENERLRHQLEVLTSQPEAIAQPETEAQKEGSICNE